MSVAAASGYDTARACPAWLCSVASAVAVDEDGTAGPPDLGERERPTFFRIDAGRKELTLLGPDSRRGEVTKLDSVLETDGAHIFSAVENGRVVSVIITDAGRMTLSIINDGVVWSAFGHALPEGQLKGHPAEEHAGTDGG
ncbi:hypothetical protein EBR56_02590 [bacterium]|nr:hypothetical protein [bacterium]